MSDAGNGRVYCKQTSTDLNVSSFHDLHARDGRGRAIGVRIRLVRHEVVEVEVAPGAHCWTACRPDELGVWHGFVAQPTRDGAPYQATTGKRYRTEAELFEGIAVYVEGARKRARALARKAHARRGWNDLSAGEQDEQDRNAAESERLDNIRHEY